MELASLRDWVADKFRHPFEVTGVPGQHKALSEDMPDDPEMVLAAICKRVTELAALLRANTDLQLKWNQTAAVELSGRLARLGIIVPNTSPRKRTVAKRVRLQDAARAAHYLAERSIFND